MGGCRGKLGRPRCRPRWDIHLNSRSLLNWNSSLAATAAGSVKKCTNGQTKTIWLPFSGSHNEKPSDPGSGLLQNGLSPRDRSNVFNYELLEETIPSVILSCFERKIRLSPADRRLLIRLVATDLLSKFSSPGRKLGRHVAIKIVLKYPKSLADTGINGKLLGDGRGSFILQLENYLANMKRANDQNDEETSSGSETLSKKKKEYIEHHAFRKGFARFNCEVTARRIRKLQNVTDNKVSNNEQR